MFRFNLETRKKLEELVKQGTTNRDLALFFQCSRSTIERELNKFGSKAEYNAEKANILPYQPDNKRDALLIPKKQVNVLHEVIRHQNRIYTKLEIIEEQLKRMNQNDIKN